MKIPRQAMVPAEQPHRGESLPELRPPAARPDPAAGAKDNSGRFWLALVVVVVLGLAVVLLLPRLVSVPTTAPAETAVQAVPTSPPGSTGQAVERSKAERTLQSYLKLRARLELANAMVWGEAEMNKVADLATEGDRFFGQRQFNLAAERYSSALQGLELLQSERGTRLATALQTGSLALDVGDSEAAIQQFSMALASESANEAAQTGLARAQVRTELLQLMAAGQRAELADDLADAQATFGLAAQLDGAYMPALEALQRVQREVTERAFRDAMSRALVALDEGHLVQARTALDEAGKLKPNEPVVRDTRQQLQLALRQQQLTSLRRQAAEKSGEEDWRAVAGLYVSVIAITPNAGFAREGLAFAQDRLRLHQQLDYYLASPARVYSAKPLANAEQLIESAGQPAANEPRLIDKIGRLRQQVATARTPIRVNLFSDGLTNVVIYRIGRLGKFTYKQLDLRPGTYTVVGSRPGYRDVRRTLTVLPGQETPVLEIRNEEAV